MKKNKPKRGFAALSKEKRTEIARRGGRVTAMNHEHMVEIARRGGNVMKRKWSKLLRSTKL